MCVCHCHCQPAVGSVGEELFKWPIITQEDEDAVIDVLRNENLSGTNITREFERDFASWIGLDEALAYPNGTMAILAAIHAAGVRRGDEIICPSMTFWYTHTQHFFVHGHLLCCVSPVFLWV